MLYSVFTWKTTFLFDNSLSVVTEFIDLLQHFLELLLLAH